GLVVFAYMGLFLGLHFLMKMGLKNIAHPLTLRYLIAGAVPALGGIAFALLFWPYALEDPFTGLSSALGAMSAYALEVRMLFKGIMINSKEIPTSYLPTWFFLTVPLGLIVGTLLYLGFSIKIFKESNKLLVGMVALAAFFPFVYVIIKDSTLYDGWRHLIFPYTCLVVLAGVAWDYAWQRAQAAPQQWIGLAVLGVMSISVLDAAAFISRNPALSYVYFNPLAGGLSGAFGNYETDYWGVGIRQGVDWMEKEGIISEDMQDTVIVVTNFKYQLDQYVKNKYKGKVKTYYVRYRERHQRQWDYALFNSRFVSGSHIKGGNWPSKSALHSINVNGTPILGIYKNEDDLAFRAQTAVKKRDFQGALRLLSTVVERNPNDETAWESIANASLQTGQYDQAKTALDKSLAIDPESVGSHNMLGLCYMNTGKINEARTTLTKAIELNQRNSIAYYYLAQIEMQAKSYDKAIEYIEGAIQSNGRFKQAYLMAAQIYDLKGDATRAKAFRDAAAKI
ncbi:MAG: tetratricopeptide repeat protein, partial [Bacteroidota bacterium]